MARVTRAMPGRRVPTGARIAAMTIVPRPSVGRRRALARSAGVRHRAAGPRAGAPDRASGRWWWPAATPWPSCARGPESEAVRRYYRPGVNWAGRVLFLVPVFGVALIAMSHGDWSFSDGWIAIGLVLWAVAAVGGRAGAVAGRAAAPGGGGRPVAAAAGSPRHRCLQVVAVGRGACSWCWSVATVVMVAKP